jgi:hypothetical protein
VSEQVRDIVAQFVDDETVVENITKALVEAELIRYKLSSKKQVNDTEVAVRAYLAEGKSIGDIGRMTGLSFQNVRYYYLKVASERDNKVYRNIKDVPAAK